MIVTIGRLRPCPVLDYKFVAVHHDTLRSAAGTMATGVSSRDELVAAIEREFEELNGLVHALAILREVSPRSLDAVLAMGEVVSSRYGGDCRPHAGPPRAGRGQRPHSDHRRLHLNASEFSSSCVGARSASLIYEMRLVVVWPDGFRISSDVIGGVRA
jgi:hypothetical protein